MHSKIEQILTLLLRAKEGWLFIIHDEHYFTRLSGRRDALHLPGLHVPLPLQLVYP